MYPHRIRLRGPWECEVIGRVPAGDATDLPAKQRINLSLPVDNKDLPDFSGRVRFSRKFGCPRRIDDYERVWMTFAGIGGTAELTLNGRVLGRQETANQAFEFDVTALLRTRNELSVVIETTDPRGGLWGEVAMEVRAGAYLRNVQMRVEADGEAVSVRAEGEVVGTSSQLLELYLLLDNATVAYATGAATDAGEKFELVSEPLDAERWRVAPRHAVRVELVKGATVWYVWEQDIFV